MPRKCTICIHPQREEINRALIEGKTTIRALSTLYNVSEMAIARHRDSNHLPATLARATEAAEVAHADNLLGRLNAYTQDARRIQRQAEQAEDYRAAIACTRELVRIVEIIAKMKGELDERPQVNILVMPEWVTLRTRILLALDRYPEARLALAEALDDR